MPNDSLPPETSAIQRRLFVVRALGDGTWLVTAEGSSERHLFANRGLAAGYAGLWASANAPSQLIECRTDGTLGTLKEFD
jgi:hypothetical protein